MHSELKLKSSWNEVKEKLKENDLSLSDADLAYTPGQEAALLERLADKMNKSTDEVRAYIESISANKSKAG